MLRKVCYVADDHTMPTLDIKIGKNLHSFPKNKPMFILYQASTKKFFNGTVQQGGSS
jgi:hypothetical protein